LLALAGLLAPGEARAFCGFYAGSAGAELFNDATQVVLMREGTRTVLTMQNSYQGPPSGFAMVVPVPVVIRRESVATLSPKLFKGLDQLTAPRVVRYAERDPCGKEEDGYGYSFDDDPLTAGGFGPNDAVIRVRPGPVVRVEAEFSVNEYDIQVLSADDSMGLDVWLHEHGYQIPAGAEFYLRPYVQGGYKFFVAKVNGARLKMRRGKAQLSPLRFHYDSERFELPIRLGLINARQQQDLLVYVLSRGTRYEVANRPNLLIPTNLEVPQARHAQFGQFYRELFDHTTAGAPGAVVTEYAWSAQSCDPCPGPTLTPGEINELGASVLPPDREGGRGEWVVTRLHARYDRSMPSSDLVFRQAPPIVGGNGAPGPGGALERAVLVGDGSSEQAQVMGGGINMFQARYAALERWKGPVACKNPVRGRWTQPSQPTQAAMELQDEGDDPAINQPPAGPKGGTCAGCEVGGGGSSLKEVLLSGLVGLAGLLRARRRATLPRA